MDTPAQSKTEAAINHWLPYWAVFQADFFQTIRSWVYRTWVLVSMLAAVGHLLYHLGIYHQAGVVQHASTWMSGLLRWTVLGSVTLIIVMTAGSISSERGTLADSVLSRGISRYQYFLGKWHARLMAVIVTFLVMGMLALLSSFCLLHEDLNVGGSLVALLGVAMLLAVVITCGVAISAMVNSTIMAISVVWILLYGTGFTLSLLPAPYPSLERALNSLPFILRGSYDMQDLSRLVGGSAVMCLATSVVGLLYFARRDV